MKTNAAPLANSATAKRRLRATSALTLAGLLIAAPAQAAGQYENGTGFAVTSGGGTTTTSGLNNENRTVNQTTQNAIFDWQTMNVGSSASLTFVQPNASARAVNHIHSADGTQIVGKLTSNGTIVLLDQNGVVFDGGAVINVGGIVAATGALDAANQTKFMNGEIFTISGLDANAAAAVINNATINVADSGLAALVAPFVTNTGTVKAKLGKVTLASGSAVTVDFTGDQLIQIVLPTANGLVQHSGSIIANGGVVTLAANTAKGALDTVINTTGIIQADSFGVQNGKIVLNGGGAKTRIAGKLSAKGNVQVTSATLDVTSDLILDKGNLNVDAFTVNLTGTIRDTGGNARSFGRISGSAGIVNVFNGAAIQQAVLLSNTGAIVNVDGGIYLGNVTIDRTLTLRGVGGPGQPLLQGTANSGKIINVTADNVTIQNLQLGGGTDGLGVPEAAQSNYGVFAAGVSGLKVLGNWIHGVLKDGVHIENAGNAPLIKALFEGDEEAPSPGGILISDNTIDYTGRDGIQVVNSNNVTIEENTIGGTIGGSAGIARYGINVNGGSNVSIGEENYIYDTVSDAIHAEGVDGLGIFDNDLSRIGQDGIDVRDSFVTFISGNTIQQTQQNGIQLADLFGGEGGGASVNDNRLCQIGENGISVSNADGISIVDNRIHTTGTNWAYKFGQRGGASGIKLVGTDGATISGNNIRDTDLDGILVSSSDNLTIDGNTIRQYNDAGIQLANSGTVTISNNTITGDGVTVVHGEGDYTFGPTTTGIRLWQGNSQQPTFTAFFFGGDSPTGGNDNITLTGNMVKDNLVGLDASNFDNGNITLADNTFVNNTTGAHFGSGLIDLTGAANTFTGGDTALLFQRATQGNDYPEYDFFAEEYEGPSFGLQFANLNLAGNTLGTTIFQGQAVNFVDLENGALFAPGSPTIIDGTQASWDGVPGGLMSPAQLASIESKIHDFVDDPTEGLIFPGFTSGNIDNNDVFHIITGASYLNGKLTVIITGLPKTGGTGGGQTNLANIEPAAGGAGGSNTAQGFANLQPGAGGTTTAAGCWSSALGSLGGGNVVSINLSGTQGEILAASAGCGGSL
jgi:filamentous hemagglutinin family protein